MQWRRKNMKRSASAFLVSIAALIAFALALTGCGGGSGTSSSSSSNAADTTAESEATAEPGGVIQIAELAEATTLDPFIAPGLTDVQVTRQINEGLYKQDESGEFLPWLATGYKLSTDGLHWTFKIREGVTFSDGKPLAADDVQFSIEKARNSGYLGALLEPVVGAKVAGPDEVEVVTKAPMPALIPLLASHYMPVVPNNYGGVSQKEFAQHPIGTGPFVLKNWAHGSSITLSKNPTYWKSGLPIADEIVFNVVADDNSRISQFRSGSIDMIGQPAWSQVASLENDPGIQIGNYGNYALDYVTLNTQTEHFEDPRMREAVSLALDRSGIIETALAGQGEPAGSFLPPTMVPYYTEIASPEQDIAKAKKLLEEAVADGADPSFTLITIGGEAYAEVTSQIIQQNLEDIGFKVKLQPLDFAAITEKLESGDNDAMLLYYYAGVPDPVELSTYYIEQIGSPSGLNAKPLEALAAEAATEIDKAKRGALYKQLQDDIFKELQLVPIDYHAAVWATQSDVTGLEVNSTNNLLLSKTGFSE
jgi:peptide/nickel transport system substrate-binding protein